MNSAPTRVLVIPPKVGIASPIPTRVHALPTKTVKDASSVCVTVILSRMMISATPTVEIVKALS